jgi:hypothetical protein
MRIRGLNQIDSVASLAKSYNQMAEPTMATVAPGTLQF